MNVNNLGKGVLLMGWIQEDSRSIEIGIFDRYTSINVSRPGMQVSGCKHLLAKLVGIAGGGCDPMSGTTIYCQGHQSRPTMSLIAPRKFFKELVYIVEVIIR